MPSIAPWYQLVPSSLFLSCQMYYGLFPGILAGTSVGHTMLRLDKLQLLFQGFSRLAGIHDLCNSNLNVYINYHQIACLRFC